MEETLQFLWESAGQGGLLLCPCHLTSPFQKPLMDPQEMRGSFPRRRTIITARHKIYDALPLDCFCVNGSTQLHHRILVDSAHLFTRINAHTCNPWERSNHRDPRWREMNFCNCSSIECSLVQSSLKRLVCSAILVWSSIPRQLSAAIE